MAGKKGGSRKTDKTKSSSDGPNPAKVGSSREADRKVGGHLDFGVPASKATAPVNEGGRAKGPEQGTGPMRSGDEGVRDSGVGHAPGQPGTGSGGDLDPDFIGFDGSGMAAAPPDRTEGPDMTEGGSGAFASGPPARGENEQPPDNPADLRPVLDTVDHSGGDATTTGNAIDGFTPEQHPDDPAT